MKWQSNHSGRNVTNNNKSGGNNDTSVITYDHLGNTLSLGQSDIKIS